jgi:hypothetical protein
MAPIRRLAGFADYGAGPTTETRCHPILDGRDAWVNTCLRGDPSRGLKSLKTSPLDQKSCVGVIRSGWWFVQNESLSINDVLEFVAPPFQSCSLCCKSLHVLILFLNYTNQVLPR